MIGKLSKELPFVLLLALSAAKSLPLVYSSSRNTRVFRHEIRAQSETCLHREYNLAMKNKASGGSQACAVEGAYAPRTSRQERRGVLEFARTKLRPYGRIRGLHLQIQLEREGADPS